jgi:hypothetical protein
MEIQIANPREFDLEDKPASQTVALFDPMFKQILAYEGEYLMIIKDKESVTPELSQKARELRLRMSKDRSAVAKLHKTLKAESLKVGRFIDSMKNSYSKPSEEMESKLKEIEIHQELVEKNRLDDIQKRRTEMLIEIGMVDPPMDMSAWDESIFDTFYEGTKLKIEKEVKLREEAEANKNKLNARKQELSSLDLQRYVDWNKFELNELTNEDSYQNMKSFAETEKDSFETKQRELNAENERLRAEQLEIQREIDTAQKRSFQLHKIGVSYSPEELMKMTSDEFEDIKRSGEARHQAIIDREKKEAEERQLIEAELAEKKLAESRAEKEKEEMLEAEAKKGDSQKIKDLISDLESIKSNPKYKFKSKKNIKLFNEVSSLIDKTVIHIQK